MKITIPLTVEVVGTIQSHLSGLLGNDAMFYELLQNADDAEAKEIFFDFRHKELRVWNSGVFQYCGDLKESNCPLQQAGGKKCDFHSISTMASRGKAEDSDNIGRFGIGFVSTYQICDTPEIESVGKKLKLDPTEAETCTFEDVPKESGTLFRLPWASDPKSGLRKTLHLSPITDDYKRRCLKDCKTALPNSLLFLKHTTNAKIKKNGKTIFSLEVDRDEDKDPNVVPLILSSGPNSTPEQWFIYQYDATAAIKPIYKEYPELETQKRKTQVSVAFRTGPNPLTPREGLLYAFLPTRKQTRLPIHVNADFFPESSRKTIISEDDRYQGRWNKTLIETAAKGVASDLERIRDEAGIKYLWDLLESAYEIVHSKRSPREPIFKCFWDSFRDAAEQGAEIGLSEKNEY